MSNYKLCPKCGNLATRNLYFSAYMCDDCDWREDFPRFDKQVEDIPNLDTSSSMTLRDQFAVEAMKVLLANNPNRPLAEVGKAAYILADIMMNVR